jgi:hypothetical protein
MTGSTMIAGWHGPVSAGLHARPKTASSVRALFHWHPCPRQRYLVRGFRASPGRVNRLGDGSSRTPGAQKNPAPGVSGAGLEVFLGVVPTALYVNAGDDTFLAEPAYNSLTGEELEHSPGRRVFLGSRRGFRHGETSDAIPACAERGGHAHGDDCVRRRPVHGGPSSRRMMPSRRCPHATGTPGQRPRIRQRATSVVHTRDGADD